MTGSPIVFRGRASLVPAGGLLVATLLLAWRAPTPGDLQAFLALGALALYYVVLRSALLAGRREIRLETDRLVVAGGRGKVELPWKSVGRIVSGLPGEMGLEVLDPPALVRSGRRPDAPELPRLEDGWLWIRGRFEAPLPDVAELANHRREEAPQV